MKESRRNTKQLEVIWDAIKNESSHPTADQIYEKVRKDLPNISLGTVYRNLQKLVSLGKLQVLSVGRSQHFDPLVTSHQHFICEQCTTSCRRSWVAMATAPKPSGMPSVT